MLAQVVAGAGASASGCGNECEWLRARVRVRVVAGTNVSGCGCGCEAALLENGAVVRHYWKKCELALRKGRKLTRLIGVRACGRMHACGSI